MEKTIKIVSRSEWAAIINKPREREELTTDFSSFSTYEHKPSEAVSGVPAPSGVIVAELVSEPGVIYHIQRN